MDAVGIQSQRKTTYLFALKTPLGIKGVVHVKEKLHRCCSSCRHTALPKAFMLLSLSSRGHKGLQIIQGWCCIAMEVLSECRRRQNLSRRF